MNSDPGGRLALLQSMATVRAYSFDGFLIVCGRTAQDNEQLSLKTARQGDLWFHARGVSGSHVLLLRDPAHPFSKTAVQVAASLAAHFSKYRAAGTCPISCCDGGLVGKTRGLATGTVTIRGERVIKVRPQIPEEIAGLQALSDREDPTV